MPRTPQRFKVPIEEAYVAELRERCERAGVVAVARAAGMARQTVWRQLTGGVDYNRNPDGIERIRHALAKVERLPLMPPPVIGVRGAAHHAWIGIADELSLSELEAIDRDRDALVAAVRRHLRRR